MIRNIYFDYEGCKENQVRVTIDEEITLKQALSMPKYIYVPDLIYKRLYQYHKAIRMIKRLKQ